MAYNYPNFMRTPDGCSFNINCIGGVKAVETGYLLLGTTPDNLLTYIETSADVALAWRDATADLLANHRPNKPLQQIDWARLAIDADPAWAAASGWSDASLGNQAPPPVGPEEQATQSGVQPLRRKATEGEG